MKNHLRNSGLIGAVIIAFLAPAFSNEGQSVVLKGSQYSASGSIFDFRTFTPGGISSATDGAPVLAIGHPYDRVRTDRVLLCFDLDGFEEQVQSSKKIALVFYVIWVNGGDHGREIELSVFKDSPSALSHEELTSDEVQVLGTTRVTHKDYYSRPYSLEITKSVQELVEQGKKKALFRFRYVNAEEAGSDEEEPSVMVVGGAGERRYPSICFTN